MLKLARFVESGRECEGRTEAKLVNHGDVSVCVGNYKDLTCEISRMNELVLPACHNSILIHLSIVLRPMME